MLQTIKIWNLLGIDAHDGGAGLSLVLWPSGAMFLDYVNQEAMVWSMSRIAAAPCLEQLFKAMFALIKVFSFTES